MSVSVFIFLIVVVLTLALAWSFWYLWCRLPPRMQRKMLLFGDFGYILGFFTGTHAALTASVDLGTFGMLVVWGQMFQYWTIGLFIGLVLSIDG